MLFSRDVEYLPRAGVYRTTIFVSLLICGFLVSCIFPRLLGYIGSYFFPYMLYFILTKAIIDIAIAIVRGMNWLRSETACDARIRIARVGGYLIIPALIVSAGAYNNDHPQIKELSIELPRKSSSIKELKLIFASDLHLDPAKDRVLDRIAARLEAVHPDLILMGGDMLQPGINPDLRMLKAKLHGLHARYGIYAILGNEDSTKTGYDLLEEPGIRILEDRVEKIDNAFYLAGYRNESEPVENLLKSAFDDLPIILLKHIPTGLENISRTRVDMQLSGHTHNGELFPFNLVMPFVYELSHGAKVKGNTLFIVSGGVRSWGAPIKTASISEILLVKAVFRSDIKAPRLLAIR